MKRMGTLLAAVVMVAGAAVVGAQSAAADVWINGYVHAPPSVYVAPPVVYHQPVYYQPPAYYHEPVYVAPRPSVVYRPVIETYPAPVRASYYAPGYTRVRDTGRRLKIDRRVYTPFGVEKHKYRFDRKDGDFRYRYDFDD